MTGDMANLRAPGFSLDGLKLLVSCQGVFQKLNGALLLRRRFMLRPSRLTVVARCERGLATHRLAHAVSFI